MCGQADAICKAGGTAVKPWLKAVWGTLAGVGIYLAAIFAVQPPVVTAPDLPLRQIAAERWVTTAPYSAIVDGQLIEIPAGFTNDLASLPACTTNILGITRDHPAIRRGALIHDWAYRSHCVSKERADWLLYWVSVQDGLEQHKAEAVLRAVRDWGFVAWQRTM